jgi:epsilon-lactone hydrolase
VNSEQMTIAGVNCYMLTPDNIPEQNRDRLLVHVHGGGYVFAPAEAATREAILMAGFGKFKVISIDYRMPPDFPYPAAMDDAMAVWREVVKTNAPKKMAIFGTSTGGGMTLAMVLRAKTEGLPLPGQPGLGERVHGFGQAVRWGHKSGHRRNVAFSRPLLRHSS